MAVPANRLTDLHELAVALTPAELEQLKLARLRELRSTIDSLRCAQEARDPLIAWALGQGRARSDHS